MRVRFRDNLGSRDGESLGVDFRKCTKGAELDVSEELLKRLVDGRFAVCVEEASPERPSKLRGVKKSDVQTVEPAEVPKGEKKPSV